MWNPVENIKICGGQANYKIGLDNVSSNFLNIPCFAKSAHAWPGSKPHLTNHIIEKMNTKLCYFGA